MDNYLLKSCVVCGRLNDTTSLAYKLELHTEYVYMHKHCVQEYVRSVNRSIDALNDFIKDN